MKLKIYRHNWVKDGKTIYGDWHMSLTIPKEEEEKYVELSKTYHYVKSLGIEESELEVGEKELAGLYDEYCEVMKNNVQKIISNSFYGWQLGNLFGKDMMSLAESLPEPKDGVDLYDEINKIIGE